MTWAICKTCNKWNETPKSFNESKHFCFCVSCNSPCFIVRVNPDKAGYTDKDKTEITVRSQVASY